jgi:hypothetical protein
MGRRGVTFDVLGLTALAGDLDAVRDDTRTLLGLVVAETAKSIRDKAAFKAPRDRGDLADAIQAEGRGLNWKVGIEDRDIQDRGGKNSAHRNPAVYGVWQELGFVSRQIKSTPFMGPAVDEEEPIHNRKVDDVLDKVIG